MQPLNPTGYEDFEVWATSPGFEVRAHISPLAEFHIQEIMQETGSSHAKAVGGFIYSHFEFIEAEVHDALEDPENAHTWMTYFNDSPLAAFLIVQMDEFHCFLLESTEAELIQNRLDAGESTTDLTWVTITLVGETGLTVSTINK